jgi:hypothetical protein
MGQKLRDDKIGTLSHSAGNILMAASVSSPVYLTIGGQQFKVTTQLSVALPAVTANTRYQVFAVQSAGVVSLVISLNQNSTGPTGYSRWKLVGSLMANATGSGFGAFIEIKGKPRFSGGSVINYTPIYTNMTISVTDHFSYTLDGEFIHVLGRYTKTGGAAAQCSISLPTNLVVASRITTGVCFGQHAFLTASASDGGLISIAGATELFPSFSGASFGGKLQGVNGNIPVNCPWSVDARVPIQGFSNTPIEDL